MGSRGLAELVLYGAVVAVVGVLAWKLVIRVGPVQGLVMLQRWGIAEPTREQGEAAADYLRERRRLCLLVLIAVAILLSIVYRLAGQGSVGESPVVLGAPLGILLVGELVAALRRPVSTARVATLVPRRLPDLVPWAWLAASAGLFVLAVLCVVPALAAQAWVDDVRAWVARHLATGTSVLLVLGLSATLTDRIIVLVRTDPPAGLGFPVLDSWLVSTWSAVNTIGIIYPLLGLAVWCALVAPWRRQRLVEATR
ncbi:hypothetical protein ACWDWO_02285 [Actinopolymorpha singaporensis]